MADNTLPELCYFNRDDSGEVVILKRGIPGYFPIDEDKFPMSVSHPAEFVKQQNDAMGVKRSQVEAMVFGSMFGWDTPGAYSTRFEHLDA